MTKFDDIAWKQIHARTVPTGRFAHHFGVALSGRPAFFAELERTVRENGDSTLAFYMFLDEFHLFRRAKFFADEPSDYFDRNTRAWFVGVVEYLCRRFKLAVPSWIEKPEYFLPQSWRKSHNDTREPEFRRRNIGYNLRHLIRL